MMRAWKKLRGIALAICVMFTVLLVPDMGPAAKAVVSSQNVSVAVGSNYNSIKVTYSKEGHKIKNLKSNSSNLFIKQTSQVWNSIYYFDGSDGSYGYSYIAIYAKKAGKYKVTFDVCNDQNKVVSKHTINVTAVKTSPPIKSATFEGKSTYFGTVVDKKSGKFKVTMNKGYKLKSITVRTYNAQGKPVEKKIKNNTSIKLGEYACKGETYFLYPDNNWCYYYTNHMFAETYIFVYYQNTKTKETHETNFVLCRTPKN